MFYTEIWLLRDQRAFCFTEVSPDFSVGVFWFWGIFHSFSTFWQVFTWGKALGQGHYQKRVCAWRLTCDQGPYQKWVCAWLLTCDQGPYEKWVCAWLLPCVVPSSGNALHITRSGSALGHCLVTKGLTRSGSVLGYCLVWSLLLVMPSTSGLTLHFIISPLWSSLHSGTGQLEMWDQRTSDIGLNVGPSFPTEGPCLFRTYWMA
jgi:hypothetical protein